jgi:hypothetical protein
MGNEIQKSVLRYLKRRARQRGDYVSHKLPKQDVIEEGNDSRTVYVSELTTEAERKIKSYFKV